MQGYILQDDAESFLLLPCQVRSGCILTSLSVENISSSCANGYTGDYCVSCKNDWYFDPLTQSCEKTSSLQYQLVQPWVLTLVVWCLLFVVFEWTLYGSQSLSSRFTGVPNVESRKYVHGVLTLLLYTGQVLIDVVGDLRQSLVHRYCGCFLPYFDYSIRKSVPASS